MTEYYTASRKGIQVSYECDDCGETWAVEYDSPGAIPESGEVTCPTPSDHHCPGGCSCVANEECECCTCSCEEGTRVASCRDAWHAGPNGDDDEDEDEDVTPGTASVPADNQCTCPECVMVRNLWQQSMDAAMRPVPTPADFTIAADSWVRVAAIDPVKPPEDKWAHLRPDAK